MNAHTRITPRRVTLRPRFCPLDVEALLCIETGDLTLDALGTYDAMTGRLNSVRINGAERSVEDVEKALRLLGCDYDGWSDDLDQDRLDDLVEEAMREIADEAADAAYQMRIEG